MGGIDTRHLVTLQNEITKSDCWKQINILQRDGNFPYPKEDGSTGYEIHNYILKNGTYLCLPQRIRGFSLDKLKA